LTIVYISIGNSDDKLTQLEWAQFQDEVDQLVMANVARTHGRWVSLATDPWQNACWCVELMPTAAWTAVLRAGLAELAQRWRQDSIAWAEVRETEFLGPGTSP